MTANFTDHHPRPIPKITPPKRDFQESEPPRTSEELYAKYDPSIGAGIALSLGGLLFYLLASVAFKWTWKRIKSRLQRTKRFSKYFPIKELPPWHVVKKLADEQGIEIPESLLIRLTARGDLITVAAGPLLTMLDPRRTSVMDPRRMSLDPRRTSKKLLRRQSELRRMSKEIELKSALRFAETSKNRNFNFNTDTILKNNLFVNQPIMVNIIDATPTCSTIFDRKLFKTETLSTTPDDEPCENEKHTKNAPKENFL